MSELILTGNSLTIEDVVGVAFNSNIRVRLSEDAKEAILSSRKTVEMSVEDGKVIYGLNTGFGSLAREVIPNEKAALLSWNLIVSHSVAVGEVLPREVVRAAILIRANTLAKGNSGVELEPVELLLELLNKNITPLVPSKGSLAASGDLCLLSHVMLCIIKPPPEAAHIPYECGVLYENQVRDAREVFASLGLQQHTLSYKSGLALNNGSTFTAGMLCLCYSEAKKLAALGVVSLSLSLEAMRGVSTAFNEEIADSRPHPGQILVASLVRGMISGSKLIDSTSKLQDAYSLRCASQDQGPFFEVLDETKKTLEIEINSATDNPLIFTESGKVMSGGNFLGTPLGVKAENLKVCSSILASISDARNRRLIDGRLSNGLPSMLTETAGLSSGMMISQYTSSSLALEIAHLSNPCNTVSLPTCEMTEDRNSNANTSVRTLSQILENLRKVIVIELQLATRGLMIWENRGSDPLELGEFTGKVYSLLKSAMYPKDEDHYLPLEMREIERLLPEITSLIEEFISPKKQKKSKKISLEPPKGMSDYTPQEMKLRKKIISIIEEIFIKHGAVTIQTPLLERREVLLGKYGEEGEKLLFDLVDEDRSALSCKYDQTVPLARFIAKRGFLPLKRYCIDRVFRRETHSNAKGRKREFYQCDFDVVEPNEDSLSDSECIYILREIFAALNIPMKLKINHRGVVVALMKMCGVEIGTPNFDVVCSAIDNLDKLSFAQVAEKLSAKGISPETIERLSLIFACETEMRLSEITSFFEKYDTIDEDTLTDLTNIISNIEAMGIDDGNIVFDFSLIRGLSYYTGVIFEGVYTPGEEKTSLGSICGGGRYDELISMFAERKTPQIMENTKAVGFGIGLERIYEILLSQQTEEEKKQSLEIDYYLTTINSDDEAINKEIRKFALRVSSDLWRRGKKIGMCYLNSKKFSKKIEWCFDNCIDRIIIIGENEMRNGRVTLKTLSERTQIEVDVDSL